MYSSEIYQNVYHTLYQNVQNVNRGYAHIYQNTYYLTVFTYLCHLALLNTFQCEICGAFDDAFPKMMQMSVVIRFAYRFFFE